MLLTTNVHLAVPVDCFTKSERVYYLNIVGTTRKSYYKVVLEETNVEIFKLLTIDIVITRNDFSSDLLQHLTVKKNSFGISVCTCLMFFLNTL